MKRIGTVVQYFEVDLVITLPFVATDANGNVYEYSEKPQLDRFADDMFMARSEFNEIGKVDLEGLDWKASLAEFKI